MDIILWAFLWLIKSVISLAMTVVVVDVALGWLIIANILNDRNQVMWSLINGISRISDFMLDPVRKRIPAQLSGSFDISPVVLLLLLKFFDLIIDGVLRKLLL
ncbi:hypothetical protein FACS1894122_04180 [Alphaproteobacteria bacterium]|nr:hypothetical protein FACS1894122_04180 [Alphaproteobacteria bacterium]